MEKEFAGIIVRCNHCMFMTTDIDITECPNCHKDSALIDMTIEDIILQNNIKYGIKE
jgi:hypothetical protein